MLGKIIDMLLGLIGIFALLGIVIWYIERDRKTADEEYKRRYRNPPPDIDNNK